MYPHRHTVVQEKEQEKCCHEIDYERDDRCLRHGVIECPICEQVTMSLATPQKTTLVLRKRFFARAVPSRRHSTDASPPEHVSPGRDFTRLPKSTSAPAPPILAWPDRTDYKEV